MCIIELVDYNENMLKTPKAAAKKTTRRAGKKAAPKAEASVEAPATEAAAE
jgi:large subunit ribosomal protein L17